MNQSLLISIIMLLTRVIDVPIYAALCLLKWMLVEEVVTQ